MSWRPLVRRRSRPSVVAIRHSSYDPSIGALNVIADPSGDGHRRATSDFVRSLFMLEPGIRSCSADRLRPPVGPASEPSAANSQMSLRLPARPSRRCPSAAIEVPSGIQVGRPYTDRGPAVMAVSRRRRDIDDVDGLAEGQVVIASAVRCEGDARAVRATRPARCRPPGRRSGARRRPIRRRPATDG